MNKEKKTLYNFGTCEERCGTDTFSTIEALIEFAEDCYKNADGYYWDDCADDYPEVIFIGIAHWISAKDFAPSLDDIADQMTDSFYCTYNIDDDAEVDVRKKEEAQEAWDVFVEKYFEMPHMITSTWIGQYNIKEHRCVKRYDENKQ